MNDLVIIDCVSHLRGVDLNLRRLIDDGLGALVALALGDVAGVAIGAAVNVIGAADGLDQINE